MARDEVCVGSSFTVTEESCLALSVLGGELRQVARVLYGRGRRAMESSIFFWRTKSGQRQATCAVVNGTKSVR